MKANEFFKKHEEEESTFEKIPEGDTYINKETLNIESAEKDFGDGKKKRYKLIFQNKKGEKKEFEVGIKVYTGVKNEFTKEGNYIRITRSGTTKEDTTYTVTSIEEN